MSTALHGPSGRIPLETAPLMIGYTPDNRLVVNDAQITSITAIIAASGQGYTITAVSSAYPVTISRQQLVPHVAHELRPNDSIRIGEATFTYEENQPAPYPNYAEAKSHVYDINNEATTIKATPEVVRNVQAGPVQPVQPVATGLESPVQQGPYTPIPNSSVQWPQYQTTGSNLYATPMAPPAPQPLAQPAGGTMPLVMRVPAPGTQDMLNLLLIALVVVIVLVAGGSGVLIYQLTRPHPVIALSSQYIQSNMPAGTVGTSLRVLGYKFSDNSPITFLLDNVPITTGVPNVHSDGSGNFRADLPVTTAWPVGIHNLTVKDGGGYLATNIGNVSIVNQGEGGTPGPNGAPPDNSIFTVRIAMKQDNSSAAPTTRVLTATGQSGSNSATVCDVLYDTGQKWTDNGTAQGGLTYSEVDTYSCKGTYQGGKLSYTETLSSSKVSYANGSTCQLTSPVTFGQWQGSFSSATTLSGTYTLSGYIVPCTAGLSASAITINPTIGTWTGTIA